MAQRSLKASRKDSLETWFRNVAPQIAGTDVAVAASEIVAVSGDASFRHYFRGFLGEHSYILVDVPPDRESCIAFVSIAQQFLAAGINVPVVHLVDYDRGFMCLSDLGETLLLEKLQQIQKQEDALLEASVLYRLAFTELLKIQSCKTSEDFPLPLFDETLLLQEMELFQHWFCEELLGLELTRLELQLLEQVFQRLIRQALEQTQLCVHRDFHSRNLLYDEGGQLGVIDFQDAVLGPVTYDLVSLLKDCYIHWPHQQVNDWAMQYAMMAQREGIIGNLEEENFLNSFAYMGVQRHLKAIGIFSRLYIRDNKPDYLQDIPRTLDYIHEVAKDKNDLNDFADWLVERVLSRMQELISRLADGEVHS